MYRYKRFLIQNLLWLLACTLLDADAGFGGKRYDFRGLFQGGFFPIGLVAQDAGDERGVHGMSGAIGDY